MERGSYYKEKTRREGGEDGGEGGGGEGGRMKGGE